MKKLLAMLVQAYFAIGSVLGLILWGSYAWGATWGMPPGGGFFSNLIASAGMIFIGTLGALVRTVLWLPSLLLWAADSSRAPFVHWLATGLLIERVGS